MTDVDPRLAAALAVQLRHRRAALGSGAERVGWKIGAGKRERIGPGPVIGHLTSAIARFGAALELVDLGPGDDPERISVDLAGAVRSVAALLGAMGQRLQAGDRLITGSVVQVAIERGDRVVADLGPLGRAEVTIAR